MKEKGSYCTLGLVLLALASCNASPGTPHKTRKEEAPTAGAVVVKMIFNRPGGLVINYMDTTYKTNVLKIKNITPRDTVIYRTLTVNQFITFDLGEFAGKTVMIKSYLCTPGDTLTLVAGDRGKAEYQASTRSVDLQEIYGMRKLGDNKILFTAPPVNRLIDSMEQQRNSFEQKIRAYVQNRADDTGLLNTLLEYNRLQFYSSIFNIDYTRFSKTDILSSRLPRYYDTLQHDAALIEHPPFTASTKTLVHNMIQYNACISGAASPDYIRNLNHIPSSLTHKKSLDGYLYDLLLRNDSINSIAQRQKVFSKIKPLLYDSASFTNRAAFSKINLSAELRSSPLTSLDGKEVSLGSLLLQDKKVILIDFWASWCIPCLQQLPALKRISKKLAGQLITISVSVDKEPVKWKNAALKYGITERSYHIKDPASHPLIKLIELGSIPRFIVLNSKGELLENDFIKPSADNFEMILQDIINKEYK